MILQRRMMLSPLRHWKNYTLLPVLRDCGEAGVTLQIPMVTPSCALVNKCEGHTAKGEAVLVFSLPLSIIVDARLFPFLLTSEWFLLHFSRKYFPAPSADA